MMRQPGCLVDLEVKSLVCFNHTKEFKMEQQLMTMGEQRSWSNDEEVFLINNYKYEDKEVVMEITPVSERSGLF